MDHFSNRGDLEIVGDRETFVLLFQGMVTPATAMYYGKLSPVGERAKHCQVAVAYTLLRIAQTPEEITEL